jgi:macrolide transport system ATP-binding/permease protein
MAPGFAVTAIVVLALGIGASVAIFAFVDSALLEPLPYADPNRLMAVNESSAESPLWPLAYPDFVDWQRMNKSLSSLDVFTGAGYLVRTREGTVLSKTFEFALANKAEYWTPLQPTSECEKRRDCHKQPTSECEKRRDCHNLYAIGRLRDGVSVCAALADMQSIAQQLERQYPDTNRDRGASVMLLSEAIVGEIRPILLLVLGGAGLLLLIACANVSGLLIVHSESRKR